MPPVQSDSASEASLRNDYVLGQDAYGAGTQSLAAHERLPGARASRWAAWSRRRPRSPGCSTPTPHAGGVVAPGSSLVTGYDFLADAADAVRAELQAGTGAAVGPADHPRPTSRRRTRFLDRGPAFDEAARQPSRRDLPRRSLQRQQRARGRLLDEPAHDRPGRVAGRPRQLDRLQRRLPLRLQPRRRRRRRRA